MPSRDETGIPKKPHGEPSGKVLGDFRIIKEISRGGMGIVYAAEQVSMKRRVALKVLYSHLSFSDEGVLKFRREAEAGGRLRHPGVVSIYVTGEHEGKHYIAQELIEGGRTLADELEACRKKDDLPIGYFREAAKCLAAVAEALNHAHDSGVIHRDVKPSNILLTARGSPKVTDFGLARIEDALVRSRTGVLAGTPYYMSPEQASTRRIRIDNRTDIFSLGVTLYETLTLERPFEGKTSREILKKILVAEPRDPRKVNPRVPGDLAVICFKAMEKNRDARYQSMDAFADDLKRFLAGEVILARPAGPVTKLLKRARRYPTLSGAIGTALMALLLLVLYIFWSYPQFMYERNRALVGQTDMDEQAQRLEAATEEVMRLSDVRVLTGLLLEEVDLWPAYPPKIPEMTEWLKAANGLLGRLGKHEETLEKWKVAGVPDDEAEVEKEWRLEILEGLINGLRALSDAETGAIQRIDKRMAFAETIHEQSVLEHEEEWDRAIESIANPVECPLYDGFMINPQTGLIPIGRNPESGLWEFSLLQTGKAPTPRPDGHLDLREESGMVFVLIPGGKLASYPGPGDGAVQVAPFFLSKFEMTLGQWYRFTGDFPGPSGPERDPDGIRRRTLLHPVQGAYWADARRVLTRLGLRLPSDQEWEYAARAGTTTPWWTGKDKRSLYGAANLADSICKRDYGWVYWNYEEWLDDGYAEDAPVDSFRPNPFGLHNVCGNVSEWCQDLARGNDPAIDTEGWPRALDLWSPRVARGGGWDKTADECRSDFRFAVPPNQGRGVRPARSIDGSGDPK